MLPLRERREDIIPVAERFVAFFAKQNHRHALGLTDEAREALGNYYWPGNLRELRNVIERSVLLCNEERISSQCFPEKIRSAERSPTVGDLITLEELELTHIRRVLASAKSIDEACRILGMDSVTLWRKRKKYGF
jgi:NtrC-family two-component system response regulator AlgB